MSFPYIRGMIPDSATIRHLKRNYCVYYLESMCTQKHVVKEIIILCFIWHQEIPTSGHSHLPVDDKQRLCSLHRSMLTKSTVSHLCQHWSRQESIPPSCPPTWRIMDVALHCHCQATSWKILCLLEIRFCWACTEMETMAFEDLHLANQIYVPWKAKKAVISCFLTFIVFFFGTYRRPSRLKRTCSLWGRSFLLCQLCFRKALFSLLPLSITSVKFI